MASWITLYNQTRKRIEKQEKEESMVVKNATCPSFEYPTKFIQHITGIDAIESAGGKSKLTKEYLDAFINHSYIDENNVRKSTKHFVCYGGRGGGKTESIGRFLLTLLYHYPDLNVLCLRATKVSLKMTAYKMFEELIERNKLPFECVPSNGIIYALIKDKNTGTIKRAGNIRFTGLEGNQINGLLSTFNISICWIEEAQLINSDAGDKLLKSMRGEGLSRYRDLQGNIVADITEQSMHIFYSFNPYTEHDWVYDKFIINKVDNAICVKYSIHDSMPFIDPLGGFLAEYIQDKKRVDKDPNFLYQFNHTWNGDIFKIRNSQVLWNKVLIKDFISPPIGHNYYYNEGIGAPFTYWGADWGFKNDPSCIIKCFLMLKEGNATPDLFIDKVAYLEKEGDFINIKRHFEGLIPELTRGYFNGRSPAFVFNGDSAPPIYVDNLRRLGKQDTQNPHNIWQYLKEAEKGKDSVLKGIHYLTFGIGNIVVRPSKQAGDNNAKLIEELEKYEYKVERDGTVITDQNPNDNYNHGIDALRYAMQHLINGGIRDHTQDKSSYNTHNFTYLTDEPPTQQPTIIHKKSQDAKDVIASLFGG